MAPPAESTWTCCRAPTGWWIWLGSERLRPGSAPAWEGAGAILANCSQILTRSTTQLEPGSRSRLNQQVAPRPHNVAYIASRIQGGQGKPWGGPGTVRGALRAHCRNCFFLEKPYNK